jgi:hypothetical protein
MVEFGGILHEPLATSWQGWHNCLRAVHPGWEVIGATDSSEICRTTCSKVRNYSQGAQDCHRTLKKPNTMEC